MARKTIKVVRTKNYVVEDYKNPPSKQIAKWRRKKVGSHIVNLAILKSGKSVATSVLHPKSEKKSANKQVQRVLNRIHKGK